MGDADEFLGKAAGDASDLAARLTGMESEPRSCLQLRMMPAWKCFVIAALVIGGCAGAAPPDHQDGHTLYIEHDAMEWCNHGCFDINDAFREVSTVGRVEVVEDDIELEPIEYLAQYEYGVEVYLMQHRDVSFGEDAWQVYGLAADKHSESDDDPGVEDVLFGLSFTDPNPEVYNEAKFVIFTGTVYNLCSIGDPQFLCWDFDYDIACRAVVLHELGHCFNLADVEVEETPPCQEPNMPGIMVSNHLSTFVQDGYNPQEIQWLSEAGRP